MKIIACQLAHYSVALKTTFKTALHAQNTANGWIVQLKSEQGHFGYGEAVPSLRVTGDSDASIVGVLRQIIFPAILGKNFENIGKFDSFVAKLITQNSAARNSVSEAFLDLLVKDQHGNLADFFAPAKGQIDTDFTLSINDDRQMQVEAQKIVDQGFSILKIKVGENAIPEEIQKLGRLVKAFPKISFRIDANQAWNVRQSLQFNQLASQKKLPIEIVEQPLAIGYEDEYDQLVKQFNFPIILDESIHEFNDARKLRAGVDFDGYNVKLEKAGSISQAKALLDYAESIEKPAMLGCMIESNIGIAFSAALANAYPIVKYVDLDSPLMFQEEIFQGWIKRNQKSFTFNSTFIETPALRGLTWL